MGDVEPPAEEVIVEDDTAALLPAKIILMCLIGFFTLLFSLSPWLISRVFKRQALDIVNVFSAAAAGIILGSFLIHQVPDTLGGFSEYLTLMYGPDEPIVEYPFATLTIGAVFLLLYGVDRLLIHGATGHHAAHAHGGGGGAPPTTDGALAAPSAGGHDDHVSGAFHAMRAIVEQRAAAGGDGSAAAAAAAVPPSCRECAAAAGAASERAAPPSCCTGDDEHDEGDGLKAHMHDDSKHSPMQAQQLQAADKSRQSAAAAAAAAAAAPPHHAAAGTGETGGTTCAGSAPLDGTAAPTALGTDAVAVAVPGHSHGGGAHAHSHGSGAPAPGREAVLRAWVFIVAISVHALFDGLSLGAESNRSSFYSILAAVVAHKALDGMATGAALYPAGFSVGRALAPLAFAAAMTPVGIAVGLGVQEAAQGSAKLLAEALVVSLSAGSFLFIAVVELLPAALHDGRWVAAKLGACAAGFTAMAVLGAYA